MALAGFAQDDAPLAVERAKAFLLEERGEKALEQASIGLDLDASSWEAHWLYLEACHATGLSARCDGEFEDLAATDPIVATVLTWHRVGRGLASPAALAELDDKDSKLAILALSELALRDGSYPVVDVMLDDVEDPFGERLRVASLMDRRLYKEAAKASKRAWAKYPEHPDAVAPLFESREGGAIRSTRRKLEAEARKTAASTIDPVWLWRMRTTALASGDDELIAVVDDNLRRLGEAPGLARLPWGQPMRRKFARTMTLTRHPELPAATPGEIRDLAGHVATAFRDMGRIPEALEMYAAARDQADSAHLATEHAVQLLRTRNYEDAKVVAEEAVALALRPSGEDLARLDTPGWATEAAHAYATLATAESGLGNRQRALDLITTATLLAPSSDWFFLRGMLQQQEGYPDAAFASFAVAHALGTPSLAELDATYRGSGDVVAAAMAIAENWSTQPGANSVNIDSEVDPEERAKRTVPRLGRMFPDWELEIGDDIVSSASTEGEIVVMSFWASWCGPCREELPALDRIQARLAKDGIDVRFLAVSTDNSERDYKRYLDKYPLESVVPVRSPDLAKRFGVRGIPALWVIGADGRARHKHAGYGPGDEARLETELRELARSE